MALISTSSRLVKVGKDYSAGSGIDIDDYVISVTGEFGKTYSAGENIDIQNYIISSKDWTNDIQNASGNAYNESTGYVNNWIEETYSTDKNALSAAIDSVSGNAGDQEVSNVVQSNSATWNEISSVSGNYWPLSSSFTAKNSKIDINGLVNHHLFLGGANPYIRGVVDGQPSYNWEIHSTHVSGYNWEYGASEYNKLNGSHNTLSSNSGTWNEVSTTVQTNSAQWSDNTGDEEVNEFVYNNSATINNVDSVVQSNSAAWGNEFDSSYMSGAIDNKLNTSSFADVSGTFLTAINIPESATWNDVSTTVQTNSAQWAEGGTGGDAEVNSFVYNNSATINEVNTTYQANSGSYQPLGNYIPYTAVDTGINKAFETNSGLNIKKQDVAGLKITRIDPTIIQLSYYSNGLIGDTDLTNNYLRFKTQTDSAYVDREKIHTWDSATYYIQNISATNDEVNTSYQTNSGTFLTAVDLSPYATTAEVDTLSSMLSGAIDYVSANAGDEFPVSADEAIQYVENNSATINDVSTTVQTNSATWSQGGSIPVSNSGDLYKLEFDGVDLYGYKSNTNIPNYVYSAVSSSDVNYSFNNVSPDPDFDDNEPFYDDLYNWSAFDIISISSNVGQIMPASSQGEDDVTAVDVYYNASYLYDYNNNQLADFSGYIGKITLDNLVISSYFDKPSYYDNIFRGELNLWFSSNLDFELYLGNEYICSVGNKVQSGTDTFEGIFVPTSAQQEVSHDSSLSGNGTVDSPLGVVPGYNETVLWENTTTANVNSLTLSENVSAFERFKIFTTTVIGNSQIVNEFNTTSANETYDVICPGGNNQPVIKFVQFTVNGTNVSATRCASLFFNSYGGSPTYRFNNADDLRIFNKVVGINRRQ